MKHHGAATSKRTMILSSTPRIGALDGGKLATKGRSSKVKLALGYVDRSGKKRWHGTSALKGSQLLAKILWMYSACSGVFKLVRQERPQ